MYLKLNPAADTGVSGAIPAAFAPIGHRLFQLGVFALVSGMMISLSLPAMTLTALVADLEGGVDVERHEDLDRRIGRKTEEALGDARRGQDGPIPSPIITTLHSIGSIGIGPLDP